MHPLREEDYVVAAKELGCEVAAIKAVAEVEAPKGGFLPNGEVTILFERHWFHRLTNGKFSSTYPAISNPKPGGYIGGAEEHKRLKLAVSLDRDAALQSASWGKFQIMGFNYKLTNSPTLQVYINRVHKSEAEQLAMFVAFLKNRGLDKVLANKQFSTFARIYNGRAYKKHNYDGRIIAAYRKYGGHYA